MSDEPEHRRSRALRVVPISQIRLDSCDQSDPYIISQLVALAKGRISFGFTRLDERRISAGFYRRSASGVEQVTNLKSAYVAGAVASIKAGARPVLDIHWQGINPNVSKFICPDDELNLAAYRQLGIRYVPCRVLKPTEAHLDESAVVFRIEGDTGRFVKAIAKSRTHVESLLGDSDLAPVAALDQLIASCVHLKVAIRAFHGPGEGGTHYHEVLHAVVQRHERTLSAIKALATQGFGEHGFALVRLAYEGLLNFYVDWLSPEFFGPRLQLLSAVRESQRMPRTNAEPFDDSHLDVLNGLAPLLETFSRRRGYRPSETIFTPCRTPRYPSLCTRIMASRSAIPARSRMRTPTC